MNLESSILGGFRAGILAIRLDGTVAYINAIGARILEGCPLEVGDSIHAVAGENSFFRLLSEALTMNYLPSRIEAEMPGKEGERQILGFTLAELREENRKTGICAFFKDLTHVEMAQVNEDLQQRLLLLGQMAAGLAHEIRNPIASIGVHCGILRSHLSQNEKLSASVRAISSEVGHVESIISECLSFVRPQELGLREVDLAELAEEVIAKFRSLYPEIAFGLRKAKAGERFEAEIDPGLFSQALSNIVANAAEALHGSGSIDIHFGRSRHFGDILRVGKLVEAYLPGHSGKEKEYIRLRIRDNGPGIPEEVQDRIFIPFFTTKKKGTGLGLALTQKIVHAHGGILDLQSAPGKGTEFIIQVPVRQKSG